MSIESIILEMLEKPIARRGGITFTLLGLPAFKKYKPKAVENAFVRLKRKDLVVFDGVSMGISEKGKNYLKNRKMIFQVFRSPFDNHAKKNLIVMFDIPEVRKAEREWFRKQLRTFGYEMIQKSVWLGPSPLPKQFVQYAKSIGLTESIRMFKVSNTPKGSQSL